MGIGSTVRLVMFNKIVWNTWEKLRWPRCESRWHFNIPCNQGTFETFKANLISAKINKATATSKWELVGQRKDVSKLAATSEDSMEILSYLCSSRGEVGSLNGHFNCEHVNISEPGKTRNHWHYWHRTPTWYLPSNGSIFPQDLTKGMQRPKIIRSCVEMHVWTFHVYILFANKTLSSNVSFTLRTLMLADRSPCPRNTHFSQIALVRGGSYLKRGDAWS